VTQPIEEHMIALLSVLQIAPELEAAVLAELRRLIETEMPPFLDARRRGQHSWKLQALIDRW